MTSPLPEPTVRPRAAWYLLVAVLWIVSAVLSGTAIATIVHVIDHGVTPIQATHVVPVTHDGLTIYSRTKPSNRDCVLQGTDNQAIQMNALSYDLNATFNGTTVYAVASTPDGVDPGEYVVSCPQLGSQLYYGDKLPLGSILVRFGISGLLGLLGLVLLIVLLVRRHTSKSQIRSQALIGAPGYGPPGWPPGWSGGPAPIPYQPAPPPMYGQPQPPQYEPPPPSPYDDGNPTS